MQIWIVIIDLKALIILKKETATETAAAGPLTQDGVDKNVNYLNATRRRVQMGFSFNHDNVL